MFVKIAGAVLEVSWDFFCFWLTAVAAASVFAARPFVLVAWPVFWFLIWGYC